MEKISKITKMLIIVAVIINIISYIFFYNKINPFYEIASFFAFLAGVLGISIFPLALASISSAFYISVKKHKEKFWYYFAISFLIFSLFALYISYATRSL